MTLQGKLNEHELKYFVAGMVLGVMLAVTLTIILMVITRG